MKKVKITVIRKMFNEDLAREYGADNLTACPMLREGQVFLQIMQSLKDCVMRPGKRSTNMFLLSHTGQEMRRFIMGIGFASREWQYAVVMTVFVL